jgi:hypothetical protein
MASSSSGESRTEYGCLSLVTRTGQAAVLAAPLMPRAAEPILPWDDAPSFESTKSCMKHGKGGAAAASSSPLGLLVYKVAKVRIGKCENVRVGV